MSALPLHHRSIQSGYLTALHHAEHGLAAQLGQLEPQIAFEVQDGFGGRPGPSLVIVRAGDDIRAHGVSVGVSAFALMLTPRRNQASVWPSRQSSI